MPDSSLVWGALAFTLRISRFFGTAPLSFKRERNCWRVSVSSAMCVYSYLFAVCLNVIVLTAFIRDAIIPVEDSIRLFNEISAVVWVVDMSTMTIISIYGILSGPSQMKQLIMYLNDIEMIFANLKYEYIMQKPEKLRCCFVALYLLGLFGLCASVIAYGVVEMFTINKSMTTFSMYAFYNVMMLILTLLELQFFLSALIARAAFQCVNEELTAIIIDMDSKTTPNSKPVAELNNDIFSCNSADMISPHAVNAIIDSVTMMYYDLASQRWSEKIHRISLAYTAVCNAVRCFDKSNGLLVIMLLFSYLINMVETPYFVIMLLIYKQKEFVLQMFWVIFHTSKVLMIVEPGHQIQREIARTHVLVGQLLNRAWSSRDPMMNELDILYNQLNLNPVVFAPLGICTLSRPLIASILAATTTYLVILLQFQK